MVQTKYLIYAPIFIFMLVARFMGFTDQAWQYAFMIGGLLGIAVTAWGIYQKELLARFAVGINTFLAIGGFAFLFMIMPILNIYGMYKGAAFFGSILWVGLITTLATPAGFIGVDHKNKQAVTSASVKLLAATAGCLLFSLLAQQYGIIVSIAVPYIALRFVRDYLAKQLKQV